MKFVTEVILQVFFSAGKYGHELALYGSGKSIDNGSGTSN
jgi:hypothetical protein